MGGELLDALTAARLEMPGSWGREPLVDVELGRGTGSDDLKSSPVVSPSMLLLSSMFSVAACIVSLGAQIGMASRALR